MIMAGDNEVQITQEDLVVLCFLPIWIYHSICLKAIPPCQIDKLSLIRALETHMEQESGGIVGFLVGYLKFNLHKLIAFHYDDVDAPNFSRLEPNLVTGIDLLQTSIIEQPAFLDYQQFLRELTLKFAENPLLDHPLSEDEKKRLMSQAHLVLRMLS